MRKIIKWLVLMGGVLALSSAASAQEIEWNDSTRLALAQCFVGEAGWRNRTEHSAIAHVLVRNWRRFVRRHQGASFEDRVRQYCAVHRVRRPTPRQAWVRRLPWGPLLEDPGMSARTDWRSWTDDWDYVRETVGLFEAGELADPLPEAVHWGGSMDGAPLGGVLLTRTVRGADGKPVHLLNRYFRIDYSVVRRAREYQRSRHEGQPTISVAEMMGSKS